MPPHVIFAPNSDGLRQPPISVRVMDAQVPVTAPLEPPLDDDEDAWEEEEDLTQADGDANNRRLLPSLRFIAGMAALGVVLALAWRYSGVEQWAASSLWPTVASQQAAAPGAQPPQGDLARAMREIDALKKTVGELAASNQQMSATIAALQAGQLELRQRPVGLPLVAWHSEVATMKYRIVAQQRSSTNSVAPRGPSTRVESRGSPKPSEQAPLQLTAPRP